MGRVAQIRVYDHKLKRVRVLKREHVCRGGKGGCLRVQYMFGLPFSWCARYSYAGDRQRRLST